MNDLRKAAEQALEALQDTCDHLPARSGVEREVDEAITALQVALAQPEQEPVDWEAVAADQAMTIAMMKIENKKEWVGLSDEQIYGHRWWDEETAFAVNKELKKKNIAPYAKNDTSDRVLHKEWVGLTDADKELLLANLYESVEDLITAIEVKLKDKNGW